jgi:hypothetical protein
MQWCVLPEEAGAKINLVDIDHPSLIWIRFSLPPRRQSSMQ